MKGDAKRLVEVIDSDKIDVSVVANPGNSTSNKHEHIGGAFMGNIVIKDGQENVVRVETKQEVNPDILGRGDAITGNIGQLMMHEVTESFEGGKIALNSGVSTPHAVINASGNVTNQVYIDAHNRATAQPTITSKVITFDRFRNLRSQYSIKGKVFHTDSLR